MKNVQIKEDKEILISDLNNSSSHRNYSTINSDNNIHSINRVPSFDPANRVTLSWHDINVYVKPKKSFFSKKNGYDVNQAKQLLKNVNGEVHPGQLLAIMGSSGAGKTTLLNVLTNRNLKLLTVEGEVLVNGQNVGPSITKLSAYVQQDDLFIGTLTVKEHLVFQALLRMDKHLSYKQRMMRVEDVILELGLKKCVNTMIGIAGKIKGISGGEAKRLAFAAEVLTNPSLMFCDEPTSGLDSFTSINVVSVLRNMAEGGRTIVCTIHQPSSEIYDMFDNLLLMAEGRVAYMGKTKRALEFFENVGLKCPINYNPADFLVHNLGIMPGKEAESKHKINKICDEFAKNTSIIASIESSIPLPSEELLDKSRYKASWCTQFRAVLWRSWLSLIREPMLTKARLIQSLAIAILLGLIYLNQPLDSKGVMNINGAIFLLLTNTTFQNVFSVINVFCLEQPIFLREHWNGMYRTDVYFLCKTIAEAPVLMFMSIVFTTILYWMVGLNSDYRAFLICLAIVILIANTAASFGYMISCITNSLQVALTLGTPLIMPLMLFGGYYLNNESIPVYFLWIKYLSWFYYGNEVLAINQWANIGNLTCIEEQPCLLHDGKAVIKMLSFDEDNFLRDIGLIVILMIFFRTLAFLALLIKSSKKT